MYNKLIALALLLSMLIVMSCSTEVINKKEQKTIDPEYPTEIACRKIHCT